MTVTARETIDRIEALIHQDVGRNVTALFEATHGGLWQAASALAADPAPRVGFLTGFYVPLGQPPAAETDGPVGTALVAAALSRAGVPCRVLTDAPCASACAAALRGAGAGGAALDVVEPGGPLDGAIAGWRDAGVTWAVAIERCGRSADGPPRNMRGLDISAHTALLDDVFLAGPWDTIGIGDGGNEIGLGGLPRDLIAQHVRNGALIACTTPASHLIMTGVSHWGCYALMAALAVLRPDWRAAMLEGLRPEADEAAFRTMMEEGPGVDGVTQRQSATIDGIGLSEHHAKLAEIRVSVMAGLEPAIPSRNVRGEPVPHSPC